MNKSPEEILAELCEKFSRNFEDWQNLDDKGLKKIFRLLREITVVGEVVSEKYNTSTHQQMCCQIYDEIFSDMVTAIYLASNGINKPANIVLRRVLELGLALIFLWDMPHRVFAWKNHDEDLSFSEMLKHVNSKGYLDFVSDETGLVDETEIFPSSQCQKIYGQLSDIAHGKIYTFESSLIERHSFRKDDWEKFINVCERIMKIIIKANLRRFEIEESVKTKMNLVPSER